MNLVWSTSTPFEPSDAIVYFDDQDFKDAPRHRAAAPKPALTVSRASESGQWPQIQCCQEVVQVLLPIG